MSNIEWTERTWNPVVGCSKISEGCRNCYAETMAHRLASMAKKSGKVDRKTKYLNVLNNSHKWNGKIERMYEALTDPIHWHKPRMIFVNSMSDLFHPNVPIDYIAKVYAVMMLANWHTYQVLTKRPERAAEITNSKEFWAMVRHAIVEISGTKLTVDELPPKFDMDNPPKNVWLGTSIENQNTADYRMPYLLRCRAALLFVSGEPLLDKIIPRYNEYGGDEYTDVIDWIQGKRYRFKEDSPFNIPDEIFDHPKIGWMILGGESGPNARQCDVKNIRILVQYCKEFKVPVFLKQLGYAAFGGLEFVGAYFKSQRYFNEGGKAWRSRVLKHRKGGDPSEWPADLQNCREWPAIGGAA